MTVDVVTLERLAAQLREDAAYPGVLNRWAKESIAQIIEDSVGAPISWPARVAGADFADAQYSGSPAQRIAFNHGVKWAVEHFSPTEKVKDRF